MKIGIIGLGLIGGSLGLDLRSLGHTVLGASQKESTCQTAKNIGAVDHARTDLESMPQSDLIFICTPIPYIIPTLQQLIPSLKPTTIVTDVGSVKTPIVQDCTALWSNFVGGHPMAGTAEQGINAAQFKLFVNRPYVITPTPESPAESVQILADLVSSIGADVYTQYSPQIHDQAVAWISHLPVMISASLIHACMSETDSHILEAAQKLASSGFASTSRVGGGNPELGVMMAKYNKEAILRSLRQYRQNLNDLINYIETENWSSLENTLEYTQQARPNFIDS
ncbi:arogenate dehydrogenase [Aphanothece hegewaldii CCALA 016]|uniref:Arogenate dehydrogenase n=1 Tax=Aphanothece hegewaldii CCALA 016 TaxID=2107694 RepID=A0A2T1M3P0_9CHRO|nr:prephenate/arogenate dehydrogenase [Aphanothece hegewaldii]PSF39457.1 arogenate dehydrogenase [Aphanothece hegewaldii CCALA 016]